MRKIKIVEPITPTKNIVSVPIESVFASVSIPVKSVCDSFLVESVESIKNSFPFNMIFDFAYLLALNVFISEISKETLNNKELKHGYLEPIKEETQPINLGTDDDPKNDPSRQYPNYLKERYISGTTNKIQGGLCLVI